MKTINVLLIALTFLSGSLVFAGGGDGGGSPQFPRCELALINGQAVELCDDGLAYDPSDKDLGGGESNIAGGDGGGPRGQRFSGGNR